MVLADFDNDGLLDLYEANGKVDASVLGDDDAFAETNRLYKGVRDQEGVSFINSEFNAMPKYTSRAAAVGDIDNNGTLDVLVTNRDAAPFLLMNKIGSPHNWIRIDIRDRNGSPVIGARVSAVIGGRTVNRELRVANSFLSSSEPIIHFGLGSEKVVNSLVINYPSGQKASYDTVDAGQVFVPAPMQ